VPGEERDDLEDLGAGLGVTDPVSGEVVVKLAASKPAIKKQPSLSCKFENVNGHIFQSFSGIRSVSGLAQLELAHCILS
jgi:hypothetical protein